MAVLLSLNSMYRDTINNITLMVGEVLPNTLEFSEGLRFFDGSGIMYKADGRTVGTEPSPLDIVSELPGEEIELFAGCREMFTIDKLYTLPNRYAAVGSDTFTIDKVGRYINRMGFVTTFAIACFDSTGRLYEGHDSMEDILYQIIDR